MASDMNHIPKGYYQIEAWSNGREVVVPGTPGGEDAQPDEETAHNCDEMGCGTFSHVIVREPLLPGDTPIALDAACKEVKP